MDDNTYTVDPKMRLPIILAMGAGILLILMEGADKQGLLLTIVLFPFFYLGAEILARKISFLPDGVTINKLLRSVELKWAEIRSLDAVQSGKKLFLIVVTDKARPILITNTIQSFDNIAERFISNLPPEKVTEHAKDMLADPPTKFAPILQAWFVFLMLAGLIAGKFLGY